MMVKNMKILFVVIIFLILNACTHSIQTTSGQAYLDKYPLQSEAAAFSSHGPDIDARVREVAAVEPILQFPARIGIAKIDGGGHLAAMSQAEAEIWFQTARELGNYFGEFVPVSRLIAEMVSPLTPTPYRQTLKDVIAKIRLGAARQHLDVVLIYEVYGKSSRSSNLLSLMDLTIIGAYLSPGQSLKAEGYAKALLLDVRNGYPYGSAEGIANQAGLSSRVGSEQRRKNLYQSTILEATEELAKEIKVMFSKLRQQFAKESDHAE